MNVWIHANWSLSWTTCSTLSTLPTTCLSQPWSHRDIGDCIIFRHILSKFPNEYAEHSFSSWRKCTFQSSLNPHVSSIINSILMYTLGWGHTLQKHPLLHYSSWLLWNLIKTYFLEIKGISRNELAQFRSDLGLPTCRLIYLTINKLL